MENRTLTENYGKAYKSTGESSLLDLFATVGALRMRTDKEIESKFKDAFAENPLLMVRLMFHARDIRGGLGERRTFRIALEWLADRHPDICRGILGYVPEYGM